MISENDIIIEPTDVKTLNGDFDIQDANNQNIKHLCVASPSNYKISPEIGVGIYNMQNLPINSFNIILAKIRSVLINDGYKNPKITGQQTGLDESDLEITAIRKQSPQRKVI